MIHRTFIVTALLGLHTLHAASNPNPIDNARASLTKAVGELQNTQKEYADLRRALYNDVNRLDDEALNLVKELRTLEREEELRTSKIKALERDLDTRKNGFIYTSGVLSQYAKAVVTRIHPAEYQLYSQSISEIDQKASKLTGDPKAELVERLKVLEQGIARLSLIAGGHRFAGKALGFAGRAIPGTILVAGPSVFFASTDKSIEGISPPADTGSGLPAVVSINKSNGAIAQTIAAGKGDLPLDGTMGKAIQAEVKNPGGQNKAMEHVMLFGDIAKNASDIGKKFFDWYGAVFAGDTLLGTGPGRYEVPPGAHVIRVEAEGRMPLQQSVELKAGEAVELTFELATADALLVTSDGKPAAVVTRHDLLAFLSN